MSKNILNALIDNPLVTSLVVVDFSILVLHKPPALFSFLMLTALIAMCLYLGQKTSLLGE